MKKAKKCIAGILSVVMLLTMAGCGKADGQGAETKPQPASGQGTAEQDEYVYVPAYRTIGENGNSVSDPVFGQGDMLYYLSIGQDEEIRLYSMDMGTDSRNEVTYDLQAGFHIGGLYQGNDGNLILMLFKIDDIKSKEASIHGISLQTISPEGNVLGTLDLTHMLNTDPDFYAAALVMDEEGNYYMSAGEVIYVLDSEGKLLYDVQVGNYIQSLFLLKTGEVVVGYSDDIGWKLEQVDTSRHELKSLESKISLSYGTYQAGETSDLLYTVDSVLYQYNLKDEAPVRVLSWVDCNVESTYIKETKQLSDGKIAVISQAWGGTSSPELAVLTRKKRSEVKEKKVITLGTFAIPYYTDSDVVAFNKQSDQYRVEIKQYGDENMDYADRIALMNADIASGNAPDMFDLQHIPYSLEDMIAKGLVEDLTPFLEKDDDLKREDFVENVLRAYERDGKLYGIMTAFSIWTLMGKVSDLGDAGSWTLEEMIEFADSVPQDVELIPDITKEWMLNLLCSMNIGHFIDEKTGQCDFTGQEFIKILEFANRFPAQAKQENESNDYFTRVHNGQAILLEEAVSAVSQYQMYEYAFGEPVNFIGYPVSGSDSGSVLGNVGTLVGMSTSSANQEGVWEFIRFLLSEYRQETVFYGGGGFPSRKEALDKQFAEDMRPEYYVDENGNQKESPKSTWSTSDFSVEVYAATQEQVDRIKNMIDTAGIDIRADGQILSIIAEEAQAYFTGQKGSEEAAAVIQNRVQNYVSEKR